jgi:hypothetical protein
MDYYAFWAAISGIGDYVAVSVYPNPVIYYPMTAGVILLNRTGSIVWFYILSKGGYVRVDMPCNGRSVVSVNDDPSNGIGCDLLYWSDGGNGWDPGDVNPVWNYWPGKETGIPQNPNDDFYTVSISENGNYIATGGASGFYLVDKNGILQQPAPQPTVQSVDSTFTGKYTASVDFWGSIWFFDKDAGLMWIANPTGAPFHCVAISKLYPCMFPYPNHDVAVSNIIPQKTIVGQGYICKINVTLTNQGDFTESFNVALYANATLIGTLSINGLAAKTSIVLIFTWNTTGFAKNKYTISACASVVPDETYIADNTFIDGTVKVTIPGDVDGNGSVQLADLVTVAKAYGSKPGDPNWNPNADVDGNTVVGLSDLVIVAKHYGQIDP